MPACLPPLCLSGAAVLRPEGFSDTPVAFADGLICDGTFAQVDLGDYLVLPGIVDLHGPLVTEQMGGADSSAAADALSRAAHDAAAAGVTTASVALGWGWQGGGYAPDRCAAALTHLHGAKRMPFCDLLPQLVLETHSVDTQDRLVTTLRRHPVASLLFTDTLDNAAQKALVDPAISSQAAEDYRTALDTRRAQAPDVPRHLCRVADMLEALEVPFGSLGDADGETRDYYNQIGARLCALPVRRAAAALARAADAPILLSASELCERAPGAAPLATLDLIHAGLGDVLVSAGAFNALVPGAFAVTQGGGCGLEDAWAMVSCTPARLLGLADRGQIAAGLRADLVLVHRKRRTVDATICGGRLTHVSPALRARFAPFADRQAMAAE
ncbi:amidohydrolase family protein [Sagittula sp. SSi028]|uniref:amidohydrolase family protein n=1 Tax=Sagittula sp. SSi028 TaxID=3400636 RepID=UPI003AF58338